MPDSPGFLTQIDHAINRQCDAGGPGIACQSQHVGVGLMNTFAVGIARPIGYFNFGYMPARLRPSSTGDRIKVATCCPLRHSDNMADLSLGMLFTAQGPADVSVFARHEVLNKLLSSRPGLPPADLLQLAMDAMKKALWQSPLMRAPLSQGRELVIRMAKAFQAAPDELKKNYLLAFMRELIPVNTMDEMAKWLSELDANVCAWEPAKREMELLGMESIFDWAWGKELITVARSQVHSDLELLSQKPFLFIPGIKPQPFWPIEEYGWAKDLKKEHGAIRQELQKLKEMPELFLPYNPAEAHYAGVKDYFIKRKNSDNLSDWNGFFLSSPYEEGVRKDFMDLCPHTTAVIQAIPRINWDEILLFSALTPGAIIPPHYGPHNAHLRLHLCLEADGPVFVRVGDHVREVKEGDLYAFDDSYLHSVINEGKRTRLNLMLSIIHPEIPDHVFKNPAMPTEAKLDDWDKETRKALAKSNWWV